MPGRPDPPVSGAFTFSCILKASSASSLEQLEQIFNSHGEEIVKEEGGAKSFSLTSSADGQYVRIEEVCDFEYALDADDCGASYVPFSSGFPGS